MNTHRRHFLAALLGAMVLATGCTTTTGGSDPATRRQSIDAGVDSGVLAMDAYLFWPQ